MLIKSTADNSFWWRLWHFINYIIGGITFFFGSLVLYPYFATKFDNALISGWLYTVGSACFLLADITEWTHYERTVVCDANAKCCQHRSLSLNFLFSVFGSAIYLVGSIMFIPAVNQTVNGLYVFIFGSVIICFSENTKIFRYLHKNKQISYGENLLNNSSSFFSSLCIALCTILFLVGSITLLDSRRVHQGATIFIFGSILFYSSGIFLFKKYFYDQSSELSTYVENNFLKE